MIRINPALIPTPESLRGYLGSAIYTVSTDDSGVRIEARETLPMQRGLEGLGPLPIGSAIPSPIGGGN